MSVARRPHLDDRRRLVIYSQRLSQQTVEGQSRQKSSDSRQTGGKSKTAGYNSRVHRRLRARWYGLVPVRRRTMLACSGVLGWVILMLAVAHWAAFWWSPLAMRPALARPLRLDRPDSFGTWLSALLLAVTAGASLLVYQLRRHRADDYHGHYRLWRISILVCLLASVDCVTHLVSWLGGGLDVLLAEREVLAGADWVRLLLVVGGAAFGIRMTAEVARDRLAAACLMLSLGLYALPIAARWNFFRLEPATAATWLPIVLLAARGMMLMAVVSYLRMLYRQVRRLEHQQTVKAALLAWLPQRTARESQPELVEHPAVATRRRRKTEPAISSVVAAAGTPKKSAKPLAVVSTPDDAAEKQGGEQDSDQASDQGSQAEAELETGAAKSRFRFGWKRRRGAADDAAENCADGIEQAEGDSVAQPAKRRFSVGLGRRRAAAEDAADNSAESIADGDEPADENSVEGDSAAQPAKRRFSFGLGRRRAAAEDADATAADEQDVQQQTGGRSEGGAPATRPQQAVNTGTAARTQPPDNESSGDEDDEDLDPDGIDWESLNKSERRRMRKLLKRQGKAA